MHVISTIGWGLYVWQTKTVMFFNDLMQTPRTCNSYFFFLTDWRILTCISKIKKKKNFRQIWWNCTNEYRLLLINPKEILLNWLFFISLISLQLIFLFCIQQGHCLQSMSMNSAYNEALGKFSKRRKKSLSKWSLKEDQSSMALHHEKVQWKHRMCGNPELCEHTIMHAHIRLNSSRYFSPELM